MEDDTIISKEFFCRVQQEGIINDIHYIDPDSIVSPYDIIHLLSFADIVIATRFHSALFTMVSGTPFILIGYQHKSAGILKMLDLERYLFEITDISSKKIQVLIEEILNNSKEIQKEILQKVSFARRLINNRIGDCLREFS